ncbi:MAG: 1-deoxy-D-xylulose-5-phosphate synthase [Candidatus Theseobacter exili]|nr:1-deoxy-D-xylulose-5-phosphate synthase [Candidatus Theseobacter exili]
MSDYLKSIMSPDDLKKIPEEELSVLAEEIRNEILRVVSVRGGHLSSSLGAVEIAIAFHYVFNSPKDHIIWDVGHQIYAHKLLTGRYKHFDTLRQFGGMAGFSKPEESEHDPFITGHSSTSISLVLGLAVARDQTGGDEKVVSVIGDGAFTAGIAFEALNHAGALGKDMLVILNANEMSISKNVGALSAYFNRIITGHFYNRIKSELEGIVEKVPGIGHRVVETAHKLEESLKGLLVPGLLFEEMGFRYFGPINGHDLPVLIRTLKNLKDIRGPKLLHVMTKKGKGYSYSEEKPDYFHSAPPFDIVSGQSSVSGKGKSYSNVFGDALVEIASKDEKIVAVTAAMTHGTGLTKFAETFPDRFFDVGIAEQHAVAFAAALARQGLKPVVAIYSTFMQRAFDQIMHDVCLTGLPVVFAIDRAGLVGEDGPTHHGVFDVSFLRSLPGLVIAQPRNQKQLRDMLFMALKSKGPVAIRFPRKNEVAEEFDGFDVIEAGTWEILNRGQDGWIIATGSQIDNANEVIDILNKTNIDFGLVDARFVKPIDNGFIMQAASEGKPIVVLEEAPVQGGLGECVSEQIMHSPFQIKALCLGLPDCFVPHGKREKLLEFCELSPEIVAKRIEQWLKSLGKR